jgi:hypothetical protein
LRAKLRKREFIGLPKQSLNKPVALVEIDGEPLVVVWSKSIEEIITLITLPMYLERHANEILPRLLEKIKREFPASFIEQVVAETDAWTK